MFQPLSRFFRTLLLASIVPFAAASAFAQSATPSGASATPASATPAPAEAEAVPGAEHKFTPAKVLKREPISYPELAHLNRVEGVIGVKFSVDEAGHVSNVYVEKSSGSTALDEAVLDPRLKQWIFQPATLDGKPIAAGLSQEFEFRLDPMQERAVAMKRLALAVGTPEPVYPKEAAIRNLKGKVTLGVRWEKENGLVDKIYLIRSSGSRLLDESALRFAYENWRTDPKKVTDEQFVKTIDFGGNS